MWEGKYQKANGKRNIICYVYMRKRFKTFQRLRILNKKWLYYLFTLFEITLESIHQFCYQQILQNQGNFNRYVLMEAHTRAHTYVRTQIHKQSCKYPSHWSVIINTCIFHWKETECDDLLPFTIIFIFSQARCYEWLKKCSVLSKWLIHVCLCQY